jgi:subtilisin-like proprotein convertase family protein
VIAHVSVTLSITHPNDSDLSAYLIAPDGTEVTLFSGVGGSGQNFTNTTFSDGASTPIASGSAPFTGTFNASAPLSTLIGHWAGGTWKLMVVDSVQNNTGTLTAWSLTLTTSEGSTTTDANGNYSFALPTGSYTIRQAVPAIDVQTGPSPGANPSGANVVSLGVGSVTGQNFADFPIVLAAPGATDSYYVRLDSTGTYVQISNSNAPLSTPTYQIALAYLPSLTFNLLGSANSVYVDFSYGSPIPTNEMLVNGAANAADTLVVIGQSGSQAFTLASAQIGPTGGPAMAYSNIASLLLQNGTTSFAGTIQSGPEMIVGGGATLQGGGTLDRSVALQGGSLSGAMTIEGNLTSTGGSISPGAASGVPGTLTIVGNVTLNAGTTLNYQLSAPNVSGGGGNDLIGITGNLSLNGTVQVVGLTGFGAGAYTLFDYTGALGGAGLTIGADVPGGGLNYRLTSGGGQVNLVASLWALGDVNHDGVINSLDIDAIYANLGSVAANLSLARYDLNGDNLVSQADVTYEVQQVLNSNYGDANLDGNVNIDDFSILLSHWGSNTAGWAQGDFGGNGVVGIDDFSILLQYWGWSSASAQVSNPAAMALSGADGAAAQSSPAVTNQAATASAVGGLLSSDSPSTQAGATVTPALGGAKSLPVQVADLLATAEASNGSVSDPTVKATLLSGQSSLDDGSWTSDDNGVDLLTQLVKPVVK